jgi:sec-independent protein translocase protein TatB
VLLFIFESIGTSELLLIGIIALIFLGPRRLPQIARKLGKTMTDLRNTTNEFKSTWEREVNFEEEERALRLTETEDAERRARLTVVERSSSVAEPAVTEIDKKAFDEMTERAAAESNTAPDTSEPTEIEEDLTADKRTWL